MLANILSNGNDNRKISSKRPGNSHLPGSRSPVRRKYKYFLDEISSTEEFIELSATRSTMSSKPYEVHCPGEPPMKSADWLLAELEAFRGDGS